MMMKDGMKWSRRPAEGEPKGQLEAQNLGKGITPSLASSWLTRDWANVTVRTFPKADMARRTLLHLSKICARKCKWSGEKVPQCALSGMAEDLVHEISCYSHATFCDLFGCGCCIVRDVGENIENTADEQTERSCNLHCSYGVFDLVQHVHGVTPTNHVLARTTQPKVQRVRTQHMSSTP